MPRRRNHSTQCLRDVDEGVTVPLALPGYRATVLHQGPMGTDCLLFRPSTVDGPPRERITLSGGTAIHVSP